jgi:hypothetical protein
MSRVLADSDNLQLSEIDASRRRRPRRYRESDEMAAMVRRVSRSMVKRAASGDLHALTALRQMREYVDQATRAAAQELHDPIEWSGGYSWTVIAQELGISRQAARQMYGLRPDKERHNGDD